MTFLDSGVAQSSHVRLEISMPALLRRLLPGVAVPLGLGLEPQVLKLVAVAGAVAEDLLLAGEILRRTLDARGAVPGRRLHSGERRLEHAAEDGLRVRDGLSGRHVDEIATGLRERARDLDGVIAREPAIHPVRRRNAHRHRLLVGPGGAHGAKDLEREAQAVFEAAAVFVAARVGERRDEA